MKWIISCCLVCFTHAACFSQEIINVVLVGNEGVTTDVKKATAFVVVKKYPGGFKRLDYQMGAPLRKLRSFSDSTLKVLDGTYIEYGFKGYAAKYGNYSNNLKIKDWYTYNDTGKMVLLEKYENGILMSTLNVDTVEKDKAKEDSLKPGEIEAKFKNGNADWMKYLTRNLNADVANNSINGGNVIAQFMVNTTGKCVEINLFKSVEFVLDEEVIRIIEKSPLWQPAVQAGKNVNAYRRQPITFVKQ